MALSAAEIQARPACPQGHPGRVYRHGRQVRTDGAYSRPRFRCVPSDGQPKHTFTVPRRQPAHGHPHGLICSSCERDYGPGDGPRTPRRYTQTVIEVASLLASIGRGDSLRLASRDARTAAQRMSLGQRQPKGTPRTRLSVPSRQNVLGARYLDVFGRSGHFLAVLPDSQRGADDQATIITISTAGSNHGTRSRNEPP